MTITGKTFVFIGGLLIMLGLAGCNPATPTVVANQVVATVDTNPLRTEVAATVFARVTQDLALTPSITPMPSPTATLQPTSAPTQATNTSATGVISGTVEAGTGDQAEWVSQSINDKTVFEPGETFTLTWTLKNSGITTWAVNYALRFFGGDPFSSAQEVPLNQEVAPGETVDIILQMKAPAKPGTYTSVWVMSTASRFNFNEPVYLEIVVAGPGTVTPTP